MLVEDEIRGSIMLSVNKKIKREDLLHEIFYTLHQWTDLNRRIFIMAHYQGQTLEGISRALKLDTEEINKILQLCDRQLYAALRDYRISGYGKPSLLKYRTGCLFASHSDLKTYAIQGESCDPVCCVCH